MDEDPPVSIPLNAGYVFRFDFGAPYNKTFEEMLYGDEVDYSQLPANFNLYSQDDQARIAAGMLSVLEAGQRGQNLDENVPLPVMPLPLKDSLARLAVWGEQ